MLSLSEKALFSLHHRRLQMAQVCHRARLVGQSPVSKCLSTALSSSAFWDLLSSSPLERRASVSATPPFSEIECSTH
jgi:hypothetical protein